MDLIKQSLDSFYSANKYVSKLSKDVLGLDGMSSEKGRHLLNNLCNFQGCRYLEIGTWKGSTLISALYANKVEFSCAVENWSQFGGPKNEFVNNCNRILGYLPNVVESDFVAFNPKDKGIDNINVYFYDGFHEEEFQVLALTHYYSALASEFVYIVDDWCSDAVKQGTSKAAEKLLLETCVKLEMPTLHNSIRDSKRWWNGMALFVFRKTKQ